MRKSKISQTKIRSIARDKLKPDRDHGRYCVLNSLAQTRKQSTRALHRIDWLIPIVQFIQLLYSFYYGYAQPSRANDESLHGPARGPAIRKLLTYQYMLSRCRWVWKSGGFQYHNIFMMEYNLTPPWVTTWFHEVDLRSQSILLWYKFRPLRGDMNKLWPQLAIFKNQWRLDNSCFCEISHGSRHSLLSNQNAGERVLMDSRQPSGDCSTVLTEHFRSPAKYRPTFSVHWRLVTESGQYEFDHREAWRANRWSAIHNRQCDSLRSDLRRCYVTTGSVHPYRSNNGIRCCWILFVRETPNLAPLASLRSASTRSKSSMLFIIRGIVIVNLLQFISANVKSDIGNNKPRHRS